ncbi:hypothetical protein PUN28_000798 [Cardiocondyla obscurior]|uniref:Uncharacterized protein n=1 Tax=Cardiocondyla obscurior TaxID=286306 RepID=A0AAW2H1M9_9HYME
MQMPIDLCTDSNTLIDNRQEKANLKLRRIEFFYLHFERNNMSTLFLAFKSTRCDLA